MEEQKKKEAILREKLKKKEIDDINKTNILLTHNKEGKKNNRKRSMDDRIKDIYEWEEKRKERLNNKIMNKEKIIKDNKHKPKIDKNSCKITVNRNPDQIFNRLYRDDVLKRKEKKELLEQIYTPSFRPNLRNDKKPKEKKRKNVSNYKNNYSINNVAFSTVRSRKGSRDNDDDDEIENEEEDDSYLEKFYEKVHDDEKVNDMIRTHIFGKGKKTRCNTTVNLNIKRNQSVKDSLFKRKKSNDENNYTHMEFIAPTRGLIGYRSAFITNTKGEGIMVRSFDSYKPYVGEINGRKNGVLVSMDNGKTLGFSLWNLQERGTLIVGPAEEVYIGMIVGIHSRDNDLNVNPCKNKHLTNTRASGSDEAIALIKPKTFTLEEALEFIASDELVEVTPSAIRLRKKILDPDERFRQNRK